jgi:hypothetical protein
MVREYWMIPTWTGYTFIFQYNKIPHHNFTVRSRRVMVITPASSFVFAATVKKAAFLLASVT